jgi:hypothetical protein
VLSLSGGAFSGSLNSQANKTYQIEVFHDTATGPGAAEGKTRIHTATITTDVSGNATFSIPASQVPNSGQLTATATADDGSTSEFSSPLSIGPKLEVSIDGQTRANGAVVTFAAPASTVLQRTIAVTNRGTTNLILQPATIAGPFVIDSNFTTGQTLSPGASASLVVRGTTTAAGTHTGTLRWTSNELNNPDFELSLREFRFSESDWTDGNADQWGAFASDNVAYSVANSIEHVTKGSRSLLFQTASGFDTGVRFPSEPVANWNLNDFASFKFDVYALNTTPIGWQGNQPIVTLVANGGSVTYQPNTVLLPKIGATSIEVPLSGNEIWTRTVTGTPDLTQVKQVEIHLDTWDYTFTTYFDNVRFDIRLPDTTKPTSRVNALPSRSSSKSFTVSVTGSDPVATGATQVVSGVKEYDLYVAKGNGAYTKFATVPASNPTTTFVGESNNTYFFRSIARDFALNVETKPLTSEARTYVPDLDPPNSSVNSVTTTSPDFVVQFSGKDVGSARLRQFNVFVSVDGANPVPIATVTAGKPDANGVFRGSVKYRAISDGLSHSYRFFTTSNDAQKNVELAPATGDVTVNALFAPVSLTATGIDVQQGSKQRSFIRNMDVQFSTSTGLNALLATLNDANEMNNRLRLQRFANDGSGPATEISLTGKVAANGSQLSINFGAGGIGGSASSGVGNGYYRLLVDEDGNGTTDRELNFYRLFGDTNGDRIVDSLDVADIALALSQRSSDLNYDVNGDGLVNLQDRLLAQNETRKPASARTIASNLPLSD